MQMYREGLLPIAPLWNYAAVSLSNVVATFCQYEALKYVSFPVQTLAKCAKMIPVMIWGSIIMRKVYKAKDYLVALIVTLGCTVFILKGPVNSKASSHMDSGAASLWGCLLMLGYLGFDGFTSTFQDRMFKGYNMTIYNQILYVTMCSSLLSMFGEDLEFCVVHEFRFIDKGFLLTQLFLAAGLLTSGQLGPAISFVGRHPICLHYIIALSAAATTGQLFISYTIRTYGALIFATVMTTRQFLSILLSSVLFLHPLSSGQW